MRFGKRVRSLRERVGSVCDRHRTTGAINGLLPRLAAAAAAVALASLRSWVDARSVYWAFHAFVMMHNFLILWSFIGYLKKLLWSRCTVANKWNDRRRFQIWVITLTIKSFLCYLIGKYVNRILWISELNPNNLEHTLQNWYIEKIRKLFLSVHKIVDNPYWPITRIYWNSKGTYACYCIRIIRKIVSVKWLFRNILRQSATGKFHKKDKICNE